MIKQLLSFIILAGAVGIGAFIFIQDQYSEEEEGSEALETYLEQDGIEREAADPENTISHESINETGTEPGMKAADFELPELKGDSRLALEDMEGKYVVVNMWATWCPPCREEMPDFVKFYEDYQDEGVEMVGINMTDTERNIEAVEQFVEEFKIPFYTLLDEEGIMEDKYSVYVMPSTYIIDPDGRMAMNRPGYISYEALEESFLEIRDNYEAGL
jgi:peroxiredoxin